MFSKVDLLRKINKNEAKTTPKWTPNRLGTRKKRPPKTPWEHNKKRLQKKHEKRRPIPPSPVNPLSREMVSGCPSPRTPLLFAHRALHYLLARIAEAIRVLSGIRLGLAETCRRVGPGAKPPEATFKVSCTFTFKGSAKTL